MRFDPMSDGLIGFEVLGRIGFTYKTVLVPKGNAGTEIEPFKWLDFLLGNLKTALLGTRHAFKFAKYARHYLAEVEYGFNRHFDFAALVSRLAVAAAQTPPCSKTKLSAISK